MEFHEWIEKNGYRCNYIAKTLDLSRNTISLLKRRCGFVGIETAKKISEFTNGEVPYESLINKKRKYKSYKKCPTCGCRTISIEF